MYYLQLMNCGSLMKGNKVIFLLSFLYNIMQNMIIFKTVRIFMIVYWLNVKLRKNDLIIWWNVHEIWM